MKKYLSFFRIQFIDMLQYRLSAFAGVLTQFFFGIMQILIFVTLTDENPSASPMNISQITAYIWMQQMFLQLFVFFSIDKGTIETIRTGNVSYELCRPIDLYNMWFVKNAAIRLSKGLLRCIPILIVAVLLPYPYGLSLEFDFTNFLFFIITAVLAFLLVISGCMIIFGATFKTISPNGIVAFSTLVIDFFTGTEVPLPFFPDSFQKIIKILPTTYMQNIPFRILGGGMCIDEIIFSICMQIGWIVILISIGKLIFKKATKNVCVQGG